MASPTFAVPQLVAAGQHEARETLPSFHYQPAAGEMPPAALQLPWTERANSRPATLRRTSYGVFAREHGA